MPVRTPHSPPWPLDDTRRLSPQHRWTSLVGLIALMTFSGAALRTFGGGPRLPSAGPNLELLRAVLAGSTLPVEPIVSVLVGLAWVLWLWIVGSLALELLLLALESVARGAGWLRAVRRVTNRFTAPLARRAVAAAFAVQILSRGVPVAAAEPLQQADVSALVQADSADAAAVRLSRMVEPQRETPSAPVYRVQAGDTLWTIAQHAYGSGTEYRRIVQANLGRAMPDGQTFTARGVIEPGWELLLADAHADVEELDGQRWYTVRSGDTLSGIAARVLQDESSWHVLLELNQGAASPDGTHVLGDPNLIWPGLRLRLPDPHSVGPEAHDGPEPPAASSAPLTRGAKPSPDTAVAQRPTASAPHSEAELTVAAARITANAISPPPEPETAPLLRTVHPLPPVAMDDASEPAPAPTPDPEPRAMQPDTVDRPWVATAASGAALALTAAAGAVAFRQRRRLRRLSREPESDVVVQGGYAAAELTHDFTRGLHGGGVDTATVVVSQLRAFLDEYNIEQVGLVSVRDGRSSTSLTLSAGASEQGLLVDLAPEFGERLEAQAEAHITSDGDVLLRVVRQRKGRLLPAAPTAGRPDDLCLPLGALPDHQIMSGAWTALGHVLIASLPGQGADVILTSLLATLAARCSPDRLRMWLVAEARALPVPVAEMPHVQRVVDPSNAGALEELLDDLRHEVTRRSELAGDAPELVLAIAELTSIREHSAKLELLIRRAASVGVRVVAATSAPSEAVQSSVLPQFSTRMVLHVDDEALSVGLLGLADAAFLGGGGRLLLRIDNREPVELFGFQVAAEHLERLVRVMQSAYATAAPTLPAPPPHPEPEQPAPDPEAVSPEPPSQQPERTGEPLDDARGAPLSAVTQPSATPACPPLRIFCFGGPRVLFKGQQIWPGHPAGDVKAWEFLLYLACQPREGVTRGDTVAALWPDDMADDPGHRIRQLRYRLRCLIYGPKTRAVADGICGSAHLRLDPAIVYSDAQEFLELVPSRRTAPAPSDAMIARLERARALYTGDLLDGPEVRRYAWAEERDTSGVTLREHFRRLYQSASLTLAELYVGADQLAAALETYRELSDLDPGDERIWLALFRIHARRGDRPALLREERRLRAALHELAADGEGTITAGMDEPSHETTVEFQRLLAELDTPRRQPAAV